MEITRDPTAASAGVLGFMSAVRPPDLPLQEVQARMGDPPQSENVLPSTGQRTGTPADQTALDALMQIFDEVDEEAAAQGVTVQEIHTSGRVAEGAGER